MSHGGIERGAKLYCRSICWNQSPLCYYGPVGMAWKQDKKARLDSWDFQPQLFQLYFYSFFLSQTSGESCRKRITFFPRFYISHTTFNIREGSFVTQKTAVLSPRMVTAVLPSGSYSKGPFSLFFQLFCHLKWKRSSAYTKWPTNIVLLWLWGVVKMPFHHLTVGTNNLKTLQCPGWFIKE